MVDIDRFSRLTKASASVSPVRSRDRCSRGATKRGQRLVKIADMGGVRYIHPDRDDATFAEQRCAGRRTDVRFQASDDVPAIRRSDQPARAVHQAGVQQRHQRRKMRIVPVMRRRRQQQQTVGLLGQNLGQAAALVLLADAMMRLIDDDKVPGDSFQFRQHPVRLRKIHRGQA